MGDNFLAVFRVYDSAGNLLDYIQAKTEFEAITRAIRMGLTATEADIHCIINL